MSAYKLARAAFDAGDELRAFDQMFHVARGAEPRLRDAAAKDLVELYARVARPEQARGFFDRLDRRRTQERLAQLADAYMLHGKVAEATVVRAQLIAAGRTDARSSTPCE